MFKNTSLRLVFPSSCVCPPGAFLPRWIAWSKVAGVKCGCQDFLLDIDGKDKRPSKQNCSRRTNQNYSNAICKATGQVTASS